MQDALRPNDEAFKRVYATGYQTWLELYHRAIDSHWNFRLQIWRTRSQAIHA